jgi:hypothetical protein
MQNSELSSRRPRRAAAVVLVAILGLSAAPLAAQAPPPATDSVDAVRAELAALKAEYERRIAALEKRLAELQSGAGATQPAVAPGAPAPGEPQAALPAPEQPPAGGAPPEVTANGPPPAAEPAGTTGTGAAQTSNYFNPSVSVIGNYLAVGGHNRTENLPSSELRESELGLQAIVDPYARADFFISFGEEGVAVEEGFATFTSLPQSLLARVGRMRTYFGKVNTLHLHVLPWPDEPLPVVNLLGSDGWIGTGVSLARLIPLPGDTFSEATLQVVRGEAEGLFAARRRSDLAYNGHYRVFRDLTDASNLDLGLSYAVGPNGTSADAKTRLSGFDFTYRYKPLVTATYRSSTVRGELFRSDRDQPGSRQRAYGWFLSGDYQLAKRWFVGARVEAADHADDASRRDTGQAVLLTFWPSEFSQLRGELRRRHYGITDETANELLLQLQFAIGAHGAHPF